MGFKERFDPNSRGQESSRILLKYPTRIPIIVEKHKNCKLKEINKTKYLVPKDMLMNQFIYVIRKRIELEPSDSLFVMTANQLASSNMTMGEIYEKYCEEDGFLYITYTSENTFG